MLKGKYEKAVLIRFNSEVKIKAQDEMLRRRGWTDERVRRHDPVLVVCRFGLREYGEALRALEEDPLVERVQGTSLDAGLVGSVDPIAAVNGSALQTRPLIIAGPCSVESESHILDIAEKVKDAGATALRGGTFKPRTSPYSFGGLGERGLEFLARAGARTGLPVVTEVLDPADIPVVSRYADILQIGARNMHNMPLIYRAARDAGASSILLKRGFGATVEEWLWSAEYALLGRFSAGHPLGGLYLCERGIRSFEPSTRFTLDVSSIPTLMEKTRLPILADPSHAAGRSALVPALARASIAAGACGILVEVHTSPEDAWSDGGQALGPRALRVLIEDLRRIYDGMQERSYAHMKV